MLKNNRHQTSRIQTETCQVIFNNSLYNLSCDNSITNQQQPRPLELKSNIDNQIEKKKGMQETSLPRQNFNIHQFYTNHINKNKPALYSNACETWNSTKVWNENYLAKTGGTEQVPIVVGGCEETTGGNRTRKRIEMPFNTFIHSLYNNSNTTTTTKNHHNKSKNNNGYLKQYNLAASPLRKDVMPEELFSKWATFGDCNVWMGSEGIGIKTGLHNDDEENVLCQIRGQKRVLLIAPEERLNLYVNQLYDSGTECCDVNASNPNLMLHPLFQHVKKMYVIDLEPGDVLYIPKFWYHEVWPIGNISISVNYFCSTPMEMIRYGIMRIGFDLLHWIGLYRNGHCVCHN